MYSWLCWLKEKALSMEPFICRHCVGSNGAVSPFPLSCMPKSQLVWRLQGIKEDFTFKGNFTFSLSETVCSLRFCMTWILGDGRNLAGKWKQAWRSCFHPLASVMRVVGSHTIQLHESSANGASADMGSAPVRHDVCRSWTWVSMEAWDACNFNIHRYS